MIDVLAHVVRRFRLLLWNIFLAMRATKINPQITLAATMIPMTPLGNPLFDEVAWLASVAPVLVELKAVDVRVTELVLGLVGTMGAGGLVTTRAVENGWVVEVVVGVVVGAMGVVDKITGTGVGVRVGVTTTATVVVLGSVVVGSVSVGSSFPPPKISENIDANGSSLPSCLFAACCFSSGARAARAPCREGTKYMSPVGLKECRFYS
jgi:hypothetical protein